MLMLFKIVALVKKFPEIIMNHHIFLKSTAILNISEIENIDYLLVFFNPEILDMWLNIGIAIGKQITVIIFDPKNKCFNMQNPTIYLFLNDIKIVNNWEDLVQNILTKN